MRGNLVHQGLTDPIQSWITTLISRCPPVEPWTRPYHEHGLMNSTLLHFYAVLAWYFSSWPSSVWYHPPNCSWAKHICPWAPERYSLVELGRKPWFVMFEARSSSLPPMLDGGSARTRSTSSNGLSPLSMWWESVSFRISGSYPLYMCFNDPESGVYAVSMVSLSFTCAAGPVVSDMSSSLGNFGGRGWTAMTENQRQ